MPLTKRLSKKLSGKWSFSLDPDNAGIFEGWFNGRKGFKNPIMVPGAWQAQGYGDHKFLHSTGNEWKAEPVEVEKVSYRGTGWYHKSVAVPAGWRGKQIWLVMGGTHPVCEIWVDGQKICRHIGTFLQHRHNITRLVQPGKTHNLTVRISEYPGEGKMRSRRNPLTGHFISWGSTWSGIYRDVSLEATAPAWIENISIFPDIKKSAARIRVEMNTIESRPPAKLRLQAKISEPNGNIAGAASKSIDIAGRMAAEITVPIENARLWSTQTPFLYHAQVAIAEDGGRISDTAVERFGLREFSVKGDKILLNGKPIWLRAYGAHCVFPMTLSPPVRRAMIEKELRQAKAYGFNGVSHYTLPHKEYLDVADELGLLIQECPVLTAGEWDFDPDILDHLNPEFVEASIRQTINHPSIMSYSFNAEVSHHNRDSRVVKQTAFLTELARNIDPSRLINACDGMHRECVGRDDTDILAIGGGITFNPPEIDAFKKPAILHEYRWWSSFPNPKLKPKYKNAAMRPFFIEYAEKVAAKNGLSDLLPVFVANSEKLQALERKIGLERARRARGLSGYCLYLGQDTSFAVEGIWDDFHDPKNVSAEEFLQTNNSTVLLIDKDYYYRNYWAGEKIPVELWLSHFGHTPIQNGTLHWRLTTPAGRQLAGGKEPLPPFPCYKTEHILRLDICPIEVRQSTKATLRVTLQSDAVKTSNQWDFWIFAKDLTPKPRGRIARIGIPTSQYEYGFFHDVAPTDNLAGFDLVVTNTMDRRLLDYITAGGRAMLIAQGVFPEIACEFKSNLYNSSPLGNSGTVIRKHPALGNFPHDGWCSLQFYGLMEDAPVINLSALPARINPIIRSINCYKKGIHRAYMCEMRVGNGSLLTTTFNFKYMRGLGRFYCEVENTYLFDQMLKYAMSPAFKPEAEIPAEFLEKSANLPQKNNQCIKLKEDVGVYQE